MAWSDKARAAAAAARKRGGKFGPRGYGVSGAKLAPKGIGTTVGISRKLKAAYKRRTDTEHRMNVAGMKSYFKASAKIGAGSQIPRLERKTEKAKANTMRLGAWGSSHTYSLPKSTPMAAANGC